jgi:hypothetical protein
MISHRQLSAQNSYAPFTSPSPFYFASPHQLLINIVSFAGSIKQNKVLLNWTVGENQEVDQFEVQRSTDGKIFRTAALVFGTGKKDADSYEFYEKTNSKKLVYQIKTIHKDQTIQFSDIIIVQAEKN